MLQSSMELFEDKRPEENNEEDIDMETILLKHENDVYNAFEKTLKSNNWESYLNELDEDNSELDKAINDIEKKIEDELGIYESLKKQAIELENEYSYHFREFEEEEKIKKHLDDVDNTIEYLSDKKSLYLDLFRFDFDHEDGIVRINDEKLGTLEDSLTEWEKVDKGWYHIFLALSMMYRNHFYEKVFKVKERKYNILIEMGNEKNGLFIKTRGGNNPEKHEFSFCNNDINSNLERLLQLLKYHFDTSKDVLSLRNLNDINLKTCSFADNSDEEYKEYCFLINKNNLKEWNYAVKLMARNIHTILSEFTFEYLRIKRKQDMRQKHI